VSREEVFQDGQDFPYEVQAVKTRAIVELNLDAFFANPEGAFAESA
jgi:hypothetical protein